MGRIKTDMVKRTTVKLMKMYPEKFTTDFTKNKLVLNDLVVIRSKKLRNVIAGYSVRLKQAQDELAPKARKKTY
ncbi:30S ribosomal protein S17e [Nanoarchaeota archaeon]